MQIHMAKILGDRRSQATIEPAPTNSLSCGVGLAAYFCVELLVNFSLYLYDLIIIMILIIAITIVIIIIMFLHFPTFA